MIGGMGWARAGGNRASANDASAPCNRRRRVTIWLPRLRSEPSPDAADCPSHFDLRRHRDMVRGPLPAARSLRDVDARDAVAELRRDPDVIETAAAIGGLPVGRAVAPPGVELGGLRGERPHRVDPAAGPLERGELLALDRRV